MRLKRISLPITLFFTLVFILTQVEVKASVKIINYKPTNFTEIASQSFYYSIGRTLRYGKTITSNSPILFKGSFFNGDLQKVLPSPNNKYAVVVSKGKVYLVSPQKPARLILEDLDNSVGSKASVNSYFFSYHSLQWNEASNYIYVIKKKRYKNTYVPVSKRDMTLMRVSVENPKRIEKVLSNLTTSRYYFIEKETICFQHATKKGNLVWKCFYNGKIIDILAQSKNQVILSDGTRLKGKPFVTYGYGNIYESAIWLTSHGLHMSKLDKEVVGLYSTKYGNKPILKIRTGHNIKGHLVDGIRQTGSIILPGGRYALVGIYNDSLKGQLLIDTKTGKYRELPSETKVYINLNSFNYTNFQFKNDSINAPEFAPIRKLRVW